VSKPWHLLTQPHHLAARFFGSLSSRPPEPEEESWAESWLLPGEIVLWRKMSNQDRRHSAKVARRFLEAREQATRAEMAGAVLHDVGKIECGVGTWGRVAADPATVELIGERGPAYATLEKCDRA
jgi:peptidyl-tRNA hydrolase